MEVQQSKKRLAEITLSPHDGGQSSSSIERLQVRGTLSVKGALRLTRLETEVSSMITCGYGGCYIVLEVPDCSGAGPADES